VEYKRLFRKLERNLTQIEHSEVVAPTLVAILERLVQDFREDLGIVGGRIYDRDGDEFVLREEYPQSSGREGIRIPLSYPPVQELLEHGFVLHDPGDPGIDASLEGKLGVGTFAAIRIGRTGGHLMAFSLAADADRSQVLHALNTVRHVIHVTLRKQHLETDLAQARLIQESVLPARVPSFDGYDLAGRSVSAEEVGGDLFDFVEVSERVLGIAIADASGHGLPAALQARDAIIGLRMGVEERLRITATIEKLNRVVSRTALSSRFISLVYAEIEPNGTVVYCNAGHNPPLLLHDGSFTELRTTGLVLGPDPAARYERGYETMTPGSILLLYTDGIVEAENGGGEAFGLERLRGLVGSHRGGSARELVESVFEAVGRHSRTDPPVDDQTVVAVLRLWE